MTRSVIIKVRGIPATFRSKKNMEAVVKLFERLKGIIATGLESGDPNLTVLDVEMEKEEGILRPVIIQSRKGMVSVNVSERQPPAPPVKGDSGRISEKSAGGRDEHRSGEEALAADGRNLIMTGLGAEKRRDSRSEKGERSRGSVDPTLSGEVSKIFRSSKPQGGGGRRTSSKQTRTWGKRLLKGDLIRRHLRYETRKLFIKGDGGGGKKIWLAVGKGGKMRVPAGWRMVRVGNLRLRQTVGTEESGEVGREVGGEGSATAVPETHPTIDEEESDVKRVHMGECGGFIDSQMGGRGMQGSP